MAFNLSKRPNVKIGIDMADYCEAAKRLRMPVAKIRGVDEVESAGSGFSIASGRPKILFEGHLFYASLKKKGLAVEAHRMQPTICYPKWVKTHYIGRDAEYGRLAKATELCHYFGISDALALRAASWGRYQILGSNFVQSGFDSVEAFVDAMFLDEDNHLEAFCEYIVNTGIDDELRNDDIIGFVRRYNGPGYARNQYHIKLPNAIRKFARQKVDCSAILKGVQVVEAMPGVRYLDPNATGFQNTGFDDRYLTETVSATANNDDGNPGPTAVETTPHEQPANDPQQSAESLPTPPVEPPPAEFVPETVDVNAPPPEGATTTTAKTTILGIAVPASLYAVFEGAKQLVTDGVLDLREIFNALLVLIRENAGYLPYLVGFIVGIVALKKVFRQISFIVQMVINANPKWHNVNIVPTVKEPAWWQFWK